MKAYQPIAFVAIVGAVFVCLLVATVYFFPSPPHKASVVAGISWGEENDYGVGLANAVVLGPTSNLPAYPVVYVQGNISTLSWHRYEGGGGNASGSCSAPTPEPGVCNVYVGVWTPAAWDTYASGGAASPIWCYSGGGSGCSNASTFSFTSSNFASVGESEWEVVIWNVVPWGLYGYFNATEYYGPVFPPQ